MDLEPLWASLTAGLDQPEVLTVLGLTAISVVLRYVPVIGWIFYPFRLFVTYVHELSHALAVLLTGGSTRRIEVEPSGNGVTVAEGGSSLLVYSVGYLGSALFGAFLVILAGRRINPDGVLIVLGIGLALLCLWRVRNGFGMIAGLALAVALVLAGVRLEEDTAAALLLFLAIQASLVALQDLVTLIQLSNQPMRVGSDAHQLDKMTGVPALLWALLWAILSVVIIYVALRFAYRLPPVELPRVEEIVR